MAPYIGFCQQNHLLFSCQQFRDLDVDTRIQKIANFKVCKNCLRPGHTEKQCHLSHCKYCTSRHNTLLHKNSETERQENSVVLSTDLNNDTNRSHPISYFSQQWSTCPIPRGASTEPTSCWTAAPRPISSLNTSAGRWVW